MNTKIAGAVAVSVLMVGTVVAIDDKQKHTEPRAPVFVPMLDAGIISTFTGTGPSLSSFGEFIVGGSR